MNREDRNLAQLQVLLLETERQLVIISAIIERVRRRWDLPVIRWRRHRRYRVRPWLTRAQREEEGQYTRLMPRLQLHDPMAYRNFIRMPPELFQELEQRITAELQKERTRMRDPMRPGLKLAVILRHLASGDSPTLPEDWLQVKPIFRHRWNIPHALGALDGKYIPIRCPQGGGSLYHNYDRFLEVGAASSSSDAQIFKHSDLRHKIEDGIISLPESESLGTGGPKVNFFILEDDTFPLKIWLMKHYSRRGMDLKERVFNYRISRGRRMVENAFGILTSCFRIFQRPMQQEPSVVTRVVMACLVLHNLLRIRQPTGETG